MSHTTGVGRDQILKARRLGRESVEKDRVNRIKEMDSLSDIERLKFDISNLESYRINCNFDLNNSTLSNNEIIINKLKHIEEQIISKKVKLAELEESDRLKNKNEENEE